MKTKLLESKGALLSPSLELFRPPFHLCFYSFTQPGKVGYFQVKFDIALVIQKCVNIQKFVSFALYVKL